MARMLTTKVQSHRGWVCPGVSHWRGLEKASLKAAAVYTFGRSERLQIGGPSHLQIARKSVDDHAVGGGEAAANRIPIYRFTDNL